MIGTQEGPLGVDEHRGVIPPPLLGPRPQAGVEHHEVEQVTEAFQILLSDDNVRAVLVNIFGGIMRCTTIASALLEAYQSVGFNVPLVVRLEGTEVTEGRKILEESGVDIITANDLTDAAKKVVAAAG